MVRRSRKHTGNGRWLPFPFLALLALGGCATRAETLQRYLNRTQDLAREGRHEQALERFVRFHHDSRDEPAMMGVRLSFALRYWQDLGDVYPPALDAIVAIRDSTERHFLDTPDQAGLADLHGLNRVLGQSERTLEAFGTLPPEAAERVWSPVVSRLAIDARRLDLLEAHGVDLLDEFARVERVFDAMVVGDADDFENAYRNRLYVSQVLPLVEIARLRGEDDTAASIADEALSRVPDERLREALPRR